MCLTLKKMAVSMLTAKEVNYNIVLEMLCDPYCDKDRLRTYLGQCQKTATEDFSDVINGVSQENGFSPLHVSVRRCMVDATQILLHFGGDFEAKGPDGETPLMLACTVGTHKFARIVISFPDHLIISILECLWFGGHCVQCHTKPCDKTIWERDTFNVICSCKFMYFRH